MRKQIPHRDEGNLEWMISTQVLWELSLYISYTYILILALSLIVPSSFIVSLNAHPIPSQLSTCQNIL